MIRVAVIGTGSIADKHIEALLCFPERCKITALINRHPERAAAKAKQYALDVHIAADYQEITHLPVDLAVICTPPFTHAAIAIAALESGKHVLVEKPMASSVEECDRMLHAAKRAGKLLSVVAQNRFTESVLRLKAVLDSGVAGEILHAQVDSFWWRGTSYFDADWRGTWETEGGGCTMNQAVHHIDLLLWLMGMPHTVTAVMQNLAHPNAEMEDISLAILEYPHAIAQITSSTIHHGEQKQIIFQCTHAKLSMPWDVQACKQRSDGFPEPDEARARMIEQVYDAYKPQKHETFTAQMADVLTAIETDRPPMVTGEDGQAALQLIAAIYQSAKQRQSATLPLRAADGFYTKSDLLRHTLRFHLSSSSME